MRVNDRSQLDDGLAQILNHDGPASTKPNDLEIIGLHDHCAERLYPIHTTRDKPITAISDLKGFIVGLFM
ncbi:MAG: hypothetical protein KAS98_01580, partial [Deltaproteobacteria bacterium]|nr:hypothetical protein [Deltaproteobacteria bacterium]